MKKKKNKILIREILNNLNYSKLGEMKLTNKN